MTVHQVTPKVLHDLLMDQNKLISGIKIDVAVIKSKMVTFQDYGKKIDSLERSRDYFKGGQIFIGAFVGLLALWSGFTNWVR